MPEQGHELPKISLSFNFLSIFSDVSGQSVLASGVLLTQVNSAGNTNNTQATIVKADFEPFNMI